MLETVLVPLDLSVDTNFEPTLEFAKRIAENYGSKLVLLYVAPSVPGYISPHIPEGIHAKTIKDARKKLSAIAADASLPSNHEVEVREGSAAPEILDCAQSLGAKLIVLNSHDPGLADYLLGSTAARVVRHAHCSVLVSRLLGQ